MVQLEQDLLMLEDALKKPGATTLPMWSEVLSDLLRSLHTMKGSAAMAGLDEVTEFVHPMESFFVLLKTRDVQVPADAFQVSFNALDLLKRMIYEGKKKKRFSSSELAVWNWFVSSEYLGSESYSGLTPSREFPHPPEPAEMPASHVGPLKTFRIYFQPDATFFGLGINVNGLLKELDGMGELLVEALTDRVPTLDSYVPGDMYFAWNMRLSTSRSLDEIRDAFIFYEDIAKITIEEEREAPAAKSSESEFPGDIIAERLRVLAKTVVTNDELTARNHGDAARRTMPEQLETLLDSVGELITLKARLQRRSSQLGDRELASISEELDRELNIVRDIGAKMRMLPLENALAALHQHVRKANSRGSRNISIRASCDGVLVDGVQLQSLEPILLQTVDLALSRIPDPSGEIDVSAQNEGRFVRIMFGFASAERMDLESLAGISGELAAIRSHVEFRNDEEGHVSIQIVLPVANAVLEGLLVEDDSNLYILPLDNVEYCLMWDKDEDEGLLDTVGGVVAWKRLSSIVEKESVTANRRVTRQLILVSRGSGKRFGLAVESIHEPVQGIAKPLKGLLAHNPYLQGIVVLDEQRIGLLLDIARVCSEEVAETAFSK